VKAPDAARRTTAHKEKAMAKKTLKKATKMESKKALTMHLPIKGK